MARAGRSGAVSLHLKSHFNARGSVASAEEWHKSHTPATDSVTAYTGFGAQSHAQRLNQYKSQRLKHGRAQTVGDGQKRSKIRIISDSANVGSTGIGGTSNKSTSPKGVVTPPGDQVLRLLKAEVPSMDFKQITEHQTAYASKEKLSPVRIEDLAINVNPEFAVLKNRVKRMAAAKQASHVRVVSQSQGRHVPLSGGREFRSGVMSATNKDKSTVRPSDHVSIQDEEPVALCNGNLYNE